jgi:tetratricopeptide (TPR) repeat protein
VWKQLYPRDYRPPNALAVALNRLGQYDRAIEEAREAQRRNPSHPFPLSNLAHAYRGAGRLAEARQTAELAVARRTQTLPLRRLLYQLALLASDPGLAERQLEWARGRAREFDLVGAQAQAVAFGGQMSGARSLYVRTADMARRQGLHHVALGYAAQAAWTEALYGFREEAVDQARTILRDEPTAAPRLRAAAALALAGSPDEAERAIRSAAKTTDTLVNLVYVPVAEAAVHLARRRPTQAIAALRDAEPYELGAVAALAPPFLRGRAFLQAGDGAAAVKEFQVVLDHRGVDPFSPLYALARLELARALAATGDKAGSRTALDEFLHGWAGADAELPVLEAARAERMRLR